MYQSLIFRNNRGIYHSKNNRNSSKILSVWRAILISLTLVRIVPFSIKVFKLASEEALIKSKNRVFQSESTDKCKLEFDIPEEILLEILRYFSLVICFTNIYFSNLDAKSLMMFASTSKNFRKFVIENNYLWKCLIMRYNYEFPLRNRVQRGVNIDGNRESVFYAHFKLKYATYGAWRSNMPRIRSNENIHSLSHLLEYESEKSLMFWSWALKLLCRIIIVGFLFPLHWMQYSYYGANRIYRTAAYTESGLSSLESFLVDLVYQTRLTYNKLRIFGDSRTGNIDPFISRKSYNWGLFVFQNLISLPLICCDLLSRILSIPNQVIIWAISMPQNKSLNSKTIKTIIGFKNFSFGSILISFQAAMFFLPVILYRLYDSWNSTYLRYLTSKSFWVNNFFLFPVIQLLWLSLIYLGIQQRSLGYLKRIPNSPVVFHFVFPIWVWTLAVKALVQVVHVFASIILTAWVIGTMVLSIATHY